MKKKWHTLIAVLIFSLCLGTTSVFAADTVATNMQVLVNNRPVQHLEPFYSGDVLYVAAAPLAKALDLRLGNVRNNRFTLQKNTLLIEMELNSDKAYINNKSTVLEAVPLRKNGVVYVPLPFVAAAAGYLAEWNEVRNMVVVSPSYKIVAYFTSWGNLKVSDIDGAKLTHINYAFANIVDGEIALSSPKEQEEPFPGRCEGEDCAKFLDDFQALRQLKQTYPHLQTLVSVGGWTWSGRFSDVALTEKSRAKFADSAVKFIREHGFDGVDLDWEYPVEAGLESNVRRAEDKGNFTLLLKQIREKLDAAGKEDGKHYLLTIASGANPKYVVNTELDQVGATVDFINIMTYDFHGDWEAISGNNAPLYFDPADPDPNAHRFYAEAAVNGHLNAGVPPKKLVLGIPFYGRSWGGCAPDNNGLYQPCEGGKTERWEANGNGFVRYWNDSTKVPYLYKAETGQFVSYEDEQSIGYKAEFIKSNGLGGAMFWELNGDRDGSLLARLAQSLKP